MSLSISVAILGQNVEGHSECTKQKC